MHPLPRASVREKYLASYKQGSSKKEQYMPEYACKSQIQSYSDGISLVTYMLTEMYWHKIGIRVRSLKENTYIFKCCSRLNNGSQRNLRLWMPFFMLAETLKVWLRFLWCRDYPEFSMSKYNFTSVLTGVEQREIWRTKEKEIWWWKQDTRVKLLKKES